jgi:hypothetical protein
MQNTYHTNGKGLVTFPSNLKVIDVNVYLHDSGMVCTHDYSCPCCRKNHAVLNLSSGIMHPCWDCQKSYSLIKVDRRSILKKIFDWF